jgi:hypothetical protein
MFAGYIVRERRKNGATHIPKPYFGRSLLKPCENPAQGITPAGGQHLSITGLLAVN